MLVLLRLLPLGPAEQVIVHHETGGEPHVPDGDHQQEFREREDGH